MDSACLDRAPSSFLHFSTQEASSKASKEDEERDRCKSDRSLRKDGTLLTISSDMTEGTSRRIPSIRLSHARRLSVYTKDSPATFQY